MAVRYLCDTDYMIVGMDEVGRGAWAGPLVVGAVGLGCSINGLKDSKKLNRTQRESLARQIYLSAKFVSIGVVEAAEIDELGLAKAHFAAYARAIASLTGTGNPQLVIDGNINYLPNIPNTSCLIKADQTVQEVSAASIVAKVYRDSLMAKFSLDFPYYGFETNAGYGTRPHIESLAKYGVSALHRKSYKPIRLLINGAA